MGRITEELKKYERVAFDTNLFIYLMERNPKYFEAVKEAFLVIEKGNVFAVTSMLVVTEILTKPLKAGNVNLVQQYKAAISTFPNIGIRNVDYDVSIAAAKVRAQYGFKTPDAIFIATALEEKAEVFITNDIRLKKLENINVIVLDDFVG